MNQKDTTTKPRKSLDAVPAHPEGLPMIPERCTESGCTSGTHGVLYDGKPYCAAHYWEVLSGALTATFEAWEAGGEVPRRFKYLLGRVSDEMKWKTEGGSYLSPARIRDRGFDFEKTENGCWFKIVRHPGAFRDGFVSMRVTQIWEADLAAKRLRLVETRGFHAGDVD